MSFGIETPTVVVTAPKMKTGTPYAMVGELNSGNHEARADVASANVTTLQLSRIEQIIEYLRVLYR